MAGETNIDSRSLSLSLVESRITKGKDESVNRLSSCASLALLCKMQFGEAVPMARHSARMATIRNSDSHSKGIQRRSGYHAVGYSKKEKKEKKKKQEARRAIQMKREDKCWEILQTFVEV